MPSVPPPRDELLLSGGSFLQTTLPGDVNRLRALLRPARLDAVVRTRLGQGWVLHHYHRDQDRPDRTWTRGPAIVADATAPAALAQRPGGRRARGSLEVLAPSREGVVHLSRTSGPGAPARWQAGAVVSPRADAVALAARGGFGGRRSQGRLDALLRDAGAVTHHVWEGGAWRAGPVLTADAWGGVALAAGPDGTLSAVWASGEELVEAELPPGSRAWTPPRPLCPAGTGDHSLAVPRGRRVTIVLAVPRASGVELLRRGGDGRWTPERPALDGGLDPVRAVAVTASDLGGWTQALTQLGGSVFQWHEQRDADSARWMRSACIRLDDPQAWRIDELPSTKVAQISGDRDSQLPPPGGSRVTLSRSRTVSGVRGTDLGVRVEHAGASYLLCGDTHWTAPLLATRDSIARITPSGPVPGAPGFEFHGAPIAISGRGVTMREYDVPLDAFSHGGAWFLLATSNHFLRQQVMGRSVLARCVDDPARVSGRSRSPLRFQALCTVSSWRFVNLSAQWVSGDAVGVDHDVLALWGAGAYRADDLRLAVLDPAPVAGLLHGGRPFASHRLGLRFFAGSDAAGVPRWSSWESDARPLFSPGAFGEISVRWLPEIGRFALLAMSGPEDPIGPTVTLRTSPTPWGPWSPRRALVDWIARGMCFGDPSSRFIRSSLDASEPVGDRIFRAQRDATGGAYAPYLFDSRLEGGVLVIRYTLSTWNPYQIVLMEHRLDPADLDD